MPFEHRSQPLLPKSLSAAAWRDMGHRLLLCLRGAGRRHSRLSFLRRIILVGFPAQRLDDPRRHGTGDALHTVAGKIFASFYALFSGIIFIAAAGILFAPVIHRFLHRLHVEIGSEQKEGSDEPGQDS